MRTKDIGDISELEFLLAATKQGLAVSKPYGDNKRYDFIVDFKGTLKRVQIKSSNPDKNNKYNITFGGNSYKGEADVLVCYLIDSKTWYLIPVEKVSAKYSIELNGTKSKYNKYLNKWDVFYA